MMIRTSCGLCGRVEIRIDTDLDEIIWEPVTDDEMATALALAATLHSIQAHLEDIEPERAA